MSPSHMEAIGFTNDMEDELMQGISKIGQESRPVPAAHGTYMYWRAENGIELWLQVNQNGLPIGYCPHFAGESRVSFGLVGPVWFKDGDRTVMDGGFHGWVSGQIDDSGDVYGDFPLDFEAPDFDTHERLQLPALVDLQMTAFAHQLYTFTSEEELAASPHVPFPMTRESFFPNCSYDPIQQSGDPYAFFTGTVIKSSTLTNPITGRTFYWLLVQTLEMQVDIVSSQVDGPRTSGSIVLCGACLFGKILHIIPNA